MFTIVPCVTAALMYYTPPIVPLTPERTQELIRILQVPMRLTKDPFPGPPEGKPPTRHFRIHWQEICELAAGGPETIPPLLAVFEDRSRSTQARMNAAYALCRSLSGAFTEPNPKAILAVQAAMVDADPAVREGALQAACGCGVNWNRGVPNGPHPFKTSFPPEALKAIFPSVVTALADPDADVAETAADAIFSLGQNGKNIPELLALLKRKEGGVRAKAMGALSEVGRDHPDVLPALLEQLSHPEDVRAYQSAIGAVGRFGSKAKGAVPELVKALKDTRGRCDGYNIPMIAINSLGMIGPEAKSAVPAILEYQKLPTTTSNDHAAVLNALEQIDLKAYVQARDYVDDQRERFRKEREGIKPGPNTPGPKPN